jgi:hypothetical protein
MRSFGRRSMSVLVILAAPGAITAQPAPPQPAPDRAALARPSAAADPVLAHGVEWTSLRLLRSRGLISDSEYDAAMHDLGGERAGDAPTVSSGGLRLTVTGYLQADFKYDSTQSCFDFCALLPIQKPGSYRGDHSRVVFSPRDSRLGFLLATPDKRGVRLTGLLEFNFFASTATTEQATWSDPVAGLRQAWIKLETRALDIMIGQSANLFGWSSGYVVAGVQEPALPGQMYQRTMQLRLSRAFHLGPVTAELATALEQPPQPDSSTPELVAGLRLSLDRWTGYHTYYLTGSAVQPASIAVTGDLRRFRIAELSPTPHTHHLRTGGGIAIDAFLPIRSATRASHDGSAALTAEYVYGAGTSDMYTGLGAAGTINPSLPPTEPGGAPVRYPANFTPGLAAYDATGRLELLQWTSYMIGLEYYPGGVGGRVGTWMNYGHMASANSRRFGGPDVNDPVLGRTRESEIFVDAGVSFDPTRATRVSSGLALFRDHYVDGTIARNYSVMSSAWLFF